jgi:hypothetical protein
LQNFQFSTSKEIFCYFQLGHMHYQPGVFSDYWLPFCILNSDYWLHFWLLTSSYTKGSIRYQTSPAGGLLAGYELHATPGNLSLFICILNFIISIACEITCYYHFPCKLLFVAKQYV